MAKIIKFPTPEERKKKALHDHNEKLRKSSDGLPPTLQESYEAAQGASDECVAMTQEMLSYMEHVIQDGVLSDWKIFEGMEFRNEAYPESKDMFVLVNIFNAMLNRYLGLPHDLHREMDRLHLKIKKTAEQNEKLREKMEQMEIFFDPDFDLDGDDDDNN